MNNILEGFRIIAGGEAFSAAAGTASSWDFHSARSGGNSLGVTKFPDTQFAPPVPSRTPAGVETPHVLFSGTPAGVGNKRSGLLGIQGACSASDFLLDQPLSPGENKSMGRITTESVIAPLKELAANSLSLSYSPISSANTPQFPRFIYSGQRGGGDPIKIGIFAGIHGDEPAGALALVELARRLEKNAALGEGYQLFLYPICNPSGFEAGTRLGASGKDLNREFWKNSAEGEVRLLEAEMLEHKFLGLVSLHSDDTCQGVYGFVRGDVLAKNLLEPALQAAAQALARDNSPAIDGFAAENGIISTCYDGILTAPLRTQNTPFEIIFETPGCAPLDEQVEATVLALEQILTEYRKFLAFAADL